MKNLSLSLTESEVNRVFANESLSDVARHLVASLVAAYFAPPAPPESFSSVGSRLRALILNEAGPERREKILAIKLIRTLSQEDVAIQDYLRTLGYPIVKGSALAKPGLGLANAKREVEMILFGYSDTALQR